jgi:uncharacterized membrane protein
MTIFASHLVVIPLQVWQICCQIPKYKMNTYYFVSLCFQEELLYYHNGCYIMVCTWIGWPLRNICVTNDHICVLFIVITIRSLHHSCHGGSNKRNTTGDTSVSGTAYPSEAPEFLVGFVLHEQDSRKDDNLLIFMLLH